LTGALAAGLFAKVFLAPGSSESAGKRDLRSPVTEENPRSSPVQLSTARLPSRDDPAGTSVTHAASPEVIHAAVDAPSTAAQRRKETVDRVRATGAAPSSERWVDGARSVVDKMMRNTDDLRGRVQWSKLECFRMGCTIEATFFDRAAFEKADEQLLGNTSGEFATWAGPKYRSAPIDIGGSRWSTSWILYNPQDQEQGESE
jgi:hypothetical protein